MEIVIRASVVYLVVWALMRGLPRRALGEMSAFDMLLLIAIGDIVQQGITQEDNSLTGAALALGTFAFWVLLWSWLSYRFDRARRVIEGLPLVVVLDGDTVEEAMAMERVPLADVLEAARQQGIGNLSEIKMGILEPSGQFSFIKVQDG